MRTLTAKEKRTVRIATVAITVYLVAFCGFYVWKFFEKRRLEYAQLVSEAQNLKSELQPYETKLLLITKLMESYRLDPAKLSRSSVVAEASAAIQKAASSGGIQLGPIRETPARSSSKELASMQIEGSGQATAVMGLLHRLNTLGYPLILDSVQINLDPTKPGMVKLNLTIIILDFEQWKNSEVPNV